MTRGRVDRTGRLGTEPMGRLLWVLSAPAITGMVVNSAYNLVDTIYVGQGVGTQALAALAVCFPIQILFLAVAQTVGIGAASIISRRLGAGDREEADRTASGSFVMVIALSFLLSAAGLYFLDPLLRAFGASPAILQPAREYLSVILLGGIVFSLSVCSSSLARAEGNTRVSMTTMILGGVTNIILDPIFIFALDMGIQGAAIATVISQAVAFFWIQRYFMSGRSHLRIRRKYMIPDLRMMIGILAIGSSSFARIAAGSIMALVVNNTVMHFGSEVHLAVLGVTNRILTFALMPLFGLVQGLQPAVGYNYGSRAYGRVLKAFRYSILSATGLCMVVTLLLQAFPGTVLSIFSRDEDLLREGTGILRMMVLAMPFVGFQIIGAGVFQALGRAGSAFLLSVSRQVLFLIPLTQVLPLLTDPPLEGVWLAFPGADVLATAVTGLFFYREVKHLRKLVERPEEGNPCGEHVFPA
jgi:putative MATE family efflux protein